MGSNFWEQPDDDYVEDEGDDFWVCQYCAEENPLDDNECVNCGAARYESNE